MEFDLRAKVRRTYRLSGKRLLLLDDTYEGGVEGGDWIELTAPSGRTTQVQVESVAWGSAFKASNPPLTLIVEWQEDVDPEPGSTVKTIPPQR